MYWQQLYSRRRNLQEGHVIKGHHQFGDASLPFTLSGITKMYVRKQISMKQTEQDCLKATLSYRKSLASD